MRVIFLDIDGVLNAECDFGGKSKPNPWVTSDDGYKYWGICSTHVRDLKEIIDRTNAKIVLVSSWKYDYENYIKNGYLNKVGKYLHNKLKKFNIDIFDTTVKYDFSHGKNRGYEITQWLEEHTDVESWIVLDDEYYADYDFLKISSNLIRTDDRYGLWKLPALQAIYKLTGEKDPRLDQEFAKINSEGFKYE